MTRTYAILHISKEAWDEIYLRLEKVDSLDIPCCGQIDMHGIALQASDHLSPSPKKTKVLRYGVEEPRSEPYRCCWCGAPEEVVMIPPRICRERMKKGFMGPCEFTPEGVSDLRRGGDPLQRLEEPLPYDHEGARRLRELDGRGSE